MTISQRMVYLALPDNKDVLAAVGRIAIRHGQLDHILRMTVKTIEDITMHEALDATRRQGSRDLRERVRKLAKQKLGEGSALVRLDAILERARRATERRNDLIHNIWAHDEVGNPVVKDDNHQFQTAPSVVELDEVANELAAVTSDLNDARLHGFLADELIRRRTQRQ